MDVASVNLHLHCTVAQNRFSGPLVSVATCSACSTRRILVFMKKLKGNEKSRLSCHTNALVSQFYSLGWTCSQIKACEVSEKRLKLGQCHIKVVQCGLGFSCFCFQWSVK